MTNQRLQGNADYESDDLGGLCPRGPSLQQEKCRTPEPPDFRECLSFFGLGCARSRHLRDLGP